MTTSLPHTHIRLRDLSELVAGIPYIIGFPPTDSLVLFTFRRCPELVLSTTVRVDLPKPEHGSLVAAEVSAAVARNEAVAAIAVVVGDSGAEHGQLIDMLRKALKDKGILLNHASWVPEVAHGEQWQCYDDPLCTDSVPDPQTSALAAATAVAGDMTYQSREAMAASLAPDPVEALIRRKNLLAVYRPTPARPYTDEDARADLELLGHALDKAMCSYDLPNLTDHQLVRLALALPQTPIKDECMAIVFSDEAKRVERLWTVMVRALPAPERAEPAFLLAMSAYMRGAGVLAAMALKIVMESNPLHGMAVLLDLALQRGVSPTDLRTLLMTSIINNNEEQADSISLEDDPPWDTTPETDYGTQPTEEPAGNPDPPPSTDFGRHDLVPKNSATCEPVSVPVVVAPAVPTGPEGCPVTNPAHSLMSPAELSADKGVADRPRYLVLPSRTPRVVAQEEKSSVGGWFAGSPAMFSPPPTLAGGAGSGGKPIHRERPVGSAVTAGPLGVAEPAGGGASRATAVEPSRIAPGPLSQRAAEALGIHGDAPVRTTVTMDPLTAFLPLPTERSGPV